MSDHPPDAPLYRPGLSEPGEPLLVPHGVIDMMMRDHTFTNMTGLVKDEWFVRPPCAAYPIPVYPPQWPEGRKRWAGLPPECMWHPLMWMPPRLSELLPVQIAHPDGTVEHSAESDDEWAIRVLAEYAVSGLFDLQTGTWMDVPAAHGIDVVENPDDRARMDAWLNGADDPVLDAIDITGHLVGDARQYADYAQAVVDVLRSASACLAAQDLTAWLTPVAAPDTDRTWQMDTLVTACGFGLELLSGIADSQGRYPEVFWRNAHTLALDAENDPAIDVQPLIKEVLDELASIADANAASLALADQHGTWAG